MTNPFENMATEDVIKSLLDALGVSKKGPERSPEPERRPGPDIQRLTLRGDRITLHQRKENGELVMRITFPGDYVVVVDNGTKSRSIPYESPTDGGERTVLVAYMAGRCRIRLT